MKTNLNKEESGRSMVEMLGVLAVIGVLSIGGISGYTVAMNKHRANDILNEASKRAVAISNQIQRGNPTPTLGEFEDNEVGGATFSDAVLNPSGSAWTTSDTQFKIGFVSGKEPSDAVKSQMKSIAGDNSIVVSFEGGLTYNNDLSARGSGSSENNCPAMLASITDSAQCTSCGGQWDDSACSGEDGKVCSNGYLSSATVFEINDEGIMKCHSCSDEGIMFVENLSECEACGNLICFEGGDGLNGIRPSVLCNMSVEDIESEEGMGISLTTAQYQKLCDACSNREMSEGKCVLKSSACPSGTLDYMGLCLSCTDAHAYDVEMDDCSICPEKVFTDGRCLDCDFGHSFETTAEECAKCTNREYDEDTSYCKLKSCVSGEFRDEYDGCVPCRAEVYYGSTAEECAKCSSSDRIFTPIAGNEIGHCKPVCKPGYVLEGLKSGDSKCVEST